MVEGERKRRYHQRSRNGCVTCKQRHMRCDEGKPFCRNCLKNGGSCGYLGSKSTKLPLKESTAQPVVLRVSPGVVSQTHIPTTEEYDPNLSPISDETSIPLKYEFPLDSYYPPESALPLCNLLGAATSDPFNSLPMKLNPKEQMLLDHFNSHCILLRRCARKHKREQLFRFITSDVALLHGALILAAQHWILVGGPKKRVESTQFQLKTETIRTVNERLGNVGVATSDGTIGAIACLILLEIFSGGAHTAALHLKGLKHLLNLRGDDYQSKSMHQMLRQIVKLADLLVISATLEQPHLEDSDAEEETECQHSLPVTEGKKLNVTTLTYFENIMGLDFEVSRLLTSLQWLAQLQEEKDRGSLTIRKSVFNGYVSDADDMIDALTKKLCCCDRKVNGEPVGSIAPALAGYIFVYLFIRRVPVENDVYEPIVGLLVEDLHCVRDSIRMRMPAEVLFWVHFMGASASTGRPELDWYKEELALDCEDLKLRTWDKAKDTLRLFAWVDGWEDDVSEALFNSIDIC